MNARGEHRESLWLAVDDDLLRQLDALAATKGITRHELARVALRLGVEAMRQPGRKEQR